MINKKEFTISLYGLGEGERVLKPLGWLNCNSFLYLKCKRAYIVNLSKMNWLVGRNCNIPILWVGKREVKPPGGLKHTYLYTLWIKELKFQILAKMVDKWGRNCNFPFLGGEKGEMKPPSGQKLLICTIYVKQLPFKFGPNQT